MVEVYLAFCALGTVLWLCCAAFAWSDRAIAFRAHPTCGTCGYDLTGIARHQICPECAGRTRSFRACRSTRRPAGAVWTLWLGPALVGASVAAMLGVSLGIGGTRFQLTIALAAGLFLALGGAARVLMNVLSVAFARTFAVLGSASVATATIAFAAMSLRPEHSANAPVFFTLAPVLGFAFGGYGFAGTFVWISRVHRRGTLAPGVSSPP